MKKHIVCLGDSNTHGYCADPADCADGGDRFNENERWPRVLEQLLGDEYLVLEEGLGGRTTVFQDPLQDGLSALDVAYPILMSHEPVDLLVIMLGTNDVKDRIGMNAACVAMGMERLITKCKSIPCWGMHAPNILIICPPHISEELRNPCIGFGCAPKSRELNQYLEPVARRQGCAYFNAHDIAEFNRIDHLHLTRASHRALAEKVAQLVPTLI